MVVPILFLDFVAAMSLAGSVVQVMIADHFGAASYLIMGSTGTCRGVLSFLTSPALGSLSDVIGRKHLFLLTVAGTATPTCCLALGASLETYMVLYGLSGLFSATFPLAFAYIADHVPPSGRASAYGTAIGLGLGGAFLVGPPLGAWLNDVYGSSAVFRACLLLTAANLVFALVAMPESARPPPPNYDELFRRANPFSAFAMLRSNRAMRLLSAIVLCFYVALWGFLSNKGVYARRRFGISVSQTAAQLALFGLVSTLSQSLGLHFARRAFSEPAIARACFLCAVLSQLTYAFATELWMLYPAMALLGVSVGGFATISSLCSQVVEHSLVGEAQGVVASMKALMEGVGPLAFAWMLPHCEGTPLPGAPWLVSAACMGAACVLCCWLEAFTADAIEAAVALSEGVEAEHASDAEQPHESSKLLRRAVYHSGGFAAQGEPMGELMGGMPRRGSAGVAEEMQPVKADESDHDTYDS